MEKLTVLIKKVDSEHFEKVTIEGATTYNILRDFVGGSIEHVGFKKDIDIWLNEEGKLIGLEPNVVLMREGQLLDVLVGDLIVTSSNLEGDTISLTDEQIEYFNTKILEDKSLISRYGILPILNFN